MALNQTEQERELWRPILEARAERLHKLVQLKAPPVIIANELLLVTKAVAGFSPEHYGEMLASEAQLQSRKAMSLCIICGKDNYLRADKGEEWCDACEREAAAEDPDGPLP